MNSFYNELKVATINIGLFLKFIARTIRLIFRLISFLVRKAIPYFLILFLMGSIITTLIVLIFYI